MKTVSEIATDKLAVSADEVERWIRSEGAKQDQARAHRSGKPVAAASETDAASSKDEEIHDQNEDDDDMWVACDACLKWRRIEKSTWTSHVASQMEASRFFGGRCSVEGSSGPSKGDPRGRPRLLGVARDPVASMGMIRVARRPLHGEK